MIFMNNTILFVFLFILSLLVQYIRYRRISRNQFNVSALLIIKFLIRSFTLCSFLVVLKYSTIYTSQFSDTSKAIFVISTKNHSNFKLSVDDQVNISSRIPEFKYKQLELWLHNTSTDQYFVYVPKTSEKTFLHLLEIDRMNEIKPHQLLVIPKSIQGSSNRIEMYQGLGNEWKRSDPNQDNFNFFELINYENDLVSPYLVHYLLILICILLAFDLGIKYRILKI